MYEASSLSFAGVVNLSPESLANNDLLALKTLREHLEIKSSHTELTLQSSFTPWPAKEGNSSV